MTRQLPTTYRSGTQPAFRLGRLLASTAIVPIFMLLLGTVPAGAQSQPNAQPQPAADVAPTPVPRDQPYPGTLTLAIDATDTERHIFTGHETIPVTPGRTPVTDHVLLFPKWLPGDHSPTGELEKFASLVITAGGQRLAWVRDPVNVYAFHVPVPQGVSQLDLAFQFLSATTTSQGRVAMTPAMLNLQWNNMLLYPAGVFSRDIQVAASVTVPAGWSLGTGLDVASSEGATTHFKTVPLNTLVDNPIFAGRYFRREDLDPGSKVPVHLDIVADSPDDLAMTPDQLAAHRRLVQQAARLFGSHHYDHYDFLLALSDEMGDIGLEHHRSSENGVGRDYFTDWDKGSSERDLLPHEYTHSWNGKFRRPADLWQPDFNTPERDSLLWVYEGQTQYWGKILAGRSGLVSKQDTLDSLAFTAATYSNGVGRSWRDLEDTTNDPVIAQRRPIPWRSWQRSEDYYEEGALVWLDVDTMLRSLTHGTKSLDDFAQGFFGVNDGSFVTLTYNFDDIVRALNAVAPHDWAALLNQRLYATGPVAPLDGITRGGYRLAFTDVESPFMKSDDQRRKMSDFSFSLGLSLNHEDSARSVIWGGPAEKAGIVAGDTIVAVNGLAYSTADLKQTLRDSMSTKTPIEILLHTGKHYRTVSIDYHGGLRYPHLVRIDGTEPLLDAIVAPRG